MAEFKINITGDASNLVAEAKKSSEALGQTAAGTTDLAKKTSNLKAKKEELKKALVELGREFPILGTMGRAALNPIVAAVGLATLAFTAAKKALDDWNQAMDEAEKRAASADFRAGMNEKSAAMQAAAQSTEQFRTAIENAATAEETLKTKTQSAIDKVRELATAQAEIDNAAQALELAQVDLAQKTGQLNGPQAIAKRSEIRQRYRSLELARKEQAEESEQRLLEEELAKSREAQPGLEKTALQAKARRDALEARLAQAKGDLAQGQEKLAEYEKEVKEKLDKLAEAENAVDSAGKVQGPYGSAMATMAAEGLAKARQDADQAIRARDLQRGLIQRNRNLVADIQGSFLPEAEAEWQAASVGATGNATRITELNASIPQLQDSVRRNRHTRTVVSTLKSQEEITQSQSQLAVEIEQASREEKTQASEIANAVQSGRAVTREMIETLRKLIQTQQEARNEIRNLREMAERTQSQLRGSR